jgi:tetratricopeptide (TPR) repeat protein
LDPVESGIIWNRLDAPTRSQDSTWEIKFVSEEMDGGGKPDEGDLAAELRGLWRMAERACGAPIKVSTLAKKVHLSASSLYAYLDGTTLPSRVVLDKILYELGATGPELGRVADLRERIEDGRRARRRKSAGRQEELPTPVVSPCQLPPDVRGFVGRTEQLSALDELLAAGKQSTAAAVAVVSGTAGVGKTALAVHWAHRIREEFPDGLLYVDLRGFDPEQPLEPTDVLGAFLRGLGVAGDSLPGHLAERAARFRTLLDRRRILVLLDNAASEEQVRHLLPSSSSCFVVVTSRNTLSGLVARHGAHLVTVNSLPLPDAVSLLRALIGDRRVDADQEGAAALAERCARLPLAIRIGADLATTRRRSPLAELAAELHRYHLDLFNAGGDERTAIRTVFSWSFLHLRSDRARAFRLLGLHPGCDVDPYACAALAAIDVSDAQLRIDDLVRANLLEEAGHRRYRMHDLMRAYAREQVRDRAESEAAKRRLFDYYLGGAAVAMNLIAPYDTNRPTVPMPATALPSLTDATGAIGWLDAERHNLLTIAESGDHAITVSALLSSYLDKRGYYTDAMRLHTLAIDVAIRIGNATLEALVRHHIGTVHMRLGHHADARYHQEHAVNFARQAGDRALESRARHHLGLIFAQLGNSDRALEHLRCALPLTQEMGDHDLEGQLRCAIGIVHFELGQFHEASASYQESQRIAQSTGNHDLYGHVLYRRGLLHQRIGHDGEAHHCQQQALTIARASGDRMLEAAALTSLGSLLPTQDDALDTLERALRVATGIGHRDLEGAARLALGQLHTDQAVPLLHQALTIARDTANRTLQVDTLNALGAALLRTDPHRAKTAHEHALTLATDTGNPWQQARSHDALARAHLALGHPIPAQDHTREAHALYDKLDLTPP